MSFRQDPFIRPVIRDVIRDVVRPVFGLPSAVSTIKWQLPFYLNLIATRGASATNNSTSVTNARVFDATSGLLIEEAPAGSAVSEGERISYDTDEGATLGSNLITPNDPIGLGEWVNNGDDTYTVTAASGNTQITWASTLTSGIPTEFKFEIISISGGWVRATANTSSGPNHTTVDIFKDVLIPNGESPRFTGQSGVTATIRVFSIAEVTPAFLNSVSKADSTKLHPTKLGTIGEDVYLLYDYRTNNDATVVIGSHRYLTSGNFNFALTATAAGTTHSAPPAIIPGDIGSTVAEDGGTVIWSVDSYYSGIATEAVNYLPHTLYEPGAVQYLLNSGVPATQTTGSLGTGDYVLWQNGEGSSTLSAGTATISTTGAATDGSPLTFTVTGAGTVTITVAGVPDEFQLEGGSVPTSFILSAGSTVTRDATSFDVTPTPAAFLRMRFADVLSQSYLTSGTIDVSYNGTTLTWTDGTNAMTHVVAMAVGDQAAVEEATGKLYYNGSLVDTNGSYSPSWGAAALGNAVDYIFDDNLDPTDTTWSTP